MLVFFKQLWPLKRLVVATKLVSSLLIKTSLMSIQLAVVLSAYSSISSGLLLVAALSITTPLYWGMLLKFYSLFITLDNYQYFIHHSWLDYFSCYWGTVLYNSISISSPWVSANSEEVTKDPCISNYKRSWYRKVTSSLLLAALKSRNAC